MQHLCAQSHCNAPTHQRLAAGNQFSGGKPTIGQLFGRRFTTRGGPVLAELRHVSDPAALL
jgi:hypothetical protein